MKDIDARRLEAPLGALRARSPLGGRSGDRSGDPEASRGRGPPGVARLGLREFQGLGLLYAKNTMKLQTSRPALGFKVKALEFLRISKQIMAFLGHTRIY